MKSYHPFSRAQALALVDALSDHVGSIWAEAEGLEEIAFITIAPYDELNQWIFFNFFIEEFDAAEALAFYKYEAFDLLVILKIHHFDNHATYRYLSLEEFMSRSNSPLLKSNTDNQDMKP